MRFALRNRNKLIEAFGEEYYSTLIKSLEIYFGRVNEKSFEDSLYSMEGFEHKFINVMSCGKQSEATFQFAIISWEFDVVRLAYFSVVS